MTNNSTEPILIARYNLVAVGKWKEARDLHYHLMAINDAVFIETNPVPIRIALGIMKKISPEVRLPPTPLSADNDRKSIPNWPTLALCKHKDED